MDNERQATFWERVIRHGIRTRLGAIGSNRDPETVGPPRLPISEPFPKRNVIL